ncbi:MAG TPA: ATP-binding protein [Woeseiaceae bacterium]|nr:ATP-binding protein [Woeseiaceae bacterium]
MSLRRQLLLVSLLTLVLPWAGCQFIRETESALREGQQQMLAGTAQAIADSLGQFPREFLVAGEAAHYSADQLYAHVLPSAPLIDGYFDDWALPEDSLSMLAGGGPACHVLDGLQQNLPAGGDAVCYVLGTFRQNLFLYVDVRDDNVVFALPGADGALYSDRVEVVSAGEDGAQRFVFAPEAPGSLVPQRRAADAAPVEETRIAAQWQATAGGFRIEARLPRQLLGPAVGLVVTDTDRADAAGLRRASFGGPSPGRLVTASPLLQSVAMGYTQPGLRLIVTDKAGWRLAEAGSLSTAGAGGEDGEASGWMRLAYNLLLEPGDAPELAQPDPSGREQQPYIRRALDGEPATSWFRSLDSGRAVVAVAQPVWSGTVQTGAVVLQQGTDAILSLTNEALTRLMSFTLIATLAVAAVLLGYASWLSLRIRRLSGAALHALDRDEVRTDLPSGAARDEIGDLSRSFSRVLRQLGEYNAYLRSLASKLSHEMRTPLTIVKSSLENLEHEPLSEEGARYTARAREGAERLQKILAAMSEASRVEELIEHAEPETFDLRETLAAAAAAYAGAWPERRFRFDSVLADAAFHGSPELIVQMLDKLVDNAVGFSREGDEIGISLSSADAQYVIRITNPGPPLPERMRAQLFDSMVSVRPEEAGKHLGLGLFVARLIAVGHGGTITGCNVDGGVAFEVGLPVA